jgi:hypothetical protein
LAGGINPYVYANLNPINAIDPLGLWSLYGTIGGGAGLTLPEGETYGVVDYVAAGTGFYMGNNNDGSNSMGWIFSQDIGKIKGASLGVGGLLGFHFGTNQDLAANDTGAAGILIGLFSLELTYNGDKPSGFTIGVGVKGWGFGAYGVESRTILIETDTNRKKSQCDD